MQPPKFLRAILALGRVPPGLRGTPEVEPFRLDPSRIRRAIWIRPDALRDAVLASDQLRLLRESLPDTELWVLCAPALEPFYASSPLGLKVLPFDRRPFRKSPGHRRTLLRTLRDMKLDLAIASPYTRDTIIDALALATRAPIRVAWRSGPADSWKVRDADEAYTHLVSSPEGLELARNRDFAAFLGLEAATFAPRIWLSESDRKWAKDTLMELGLDSTRLIVAYSGVQRPERHYGRYGEALALAFPRGEAQLLTVGLPQDAEGNDLMRRSYPGPSVDLTGRTTLIQTAALLAQARLAFGGETGPAHVALAVGTPQVALLGGGHFGRFMPASPLTTFAALPLDCFGCDWRCTFERPHCVSDLPPQALAAALRTAWSGSSDRSRGIPASDPAWSGAPHPVDPPPLPGLDWLMPPRE